MRSHLASLTIVSIALLVAGCGSGGSATHGFGALPKPVPASPAPPVVLAEPAPSSAAPAAPAPKAAAPADAALAKSRAAAAKLRHQRAVARHKLHLARVKAVREHRRAAAREKQLQQELAAATRAPAPSHRATHHKTAPISASDVSVDENQRAARVIVVRFYDLMNAHDGTACDMLSVRFLHDHFPGDDTDSQRANCATGVESLQSPVSVLIQGSGDEGTGVWVKVVSHLGDGSQNQVIHLVPFFKSWMIDSVEAVASR